MTRTPEQIVRSIRRTCLGLQTDADGVPLLTRCGSDFNDVILAGPLDGQAHTYTCPRCGIEGHYTAPWFPAA